MPTDGDRQFREARLMIAELRKIEVANPLDWEATFRIDRGRFPQPFSASYQLDLCLRPLRMEFIYTSRDGPRRRWGPSGLDEPDCSIFTLDKYWPDEPARTTALESLKKLLVHPSAARCDM